jgi:putrescine aminotransferase
MTVTDDRQELLSALGRHWNPTAATLLAAAGRGVEQSSSGAEVIVEDGTRGLDLAGSYGVFLVGHGNERVRDAARGALLDAPAIAPGALHPATAELFQALAEVLPPNLTRYALGCSGAEIAEIALRAVHLARPDRRRIVVADGGYHGKTLGALAVLGQGNHRAPFEPLGGELVTVPYGDAQAVREALAGGDVAAVFIEPVLGGAHLTVPPAGYLAAVAAACAQTGTLLVGDEIQTGFGRTGKLFASDHDGVVADIMLLSKSLTGGCMPIAVCALSEAVLDDARGHPDWDPAILAGSCVSAVAVAAAHATIREVREHELPERAARIGPLLTEGLADAVRRHPKHLLGAPGIGLMAGLRTRNPAVETLISMGMAQRGIHTGHSLNEDIDHPVLRFYPPLTVDAAQIGRVLAALEEVLTGLDRWPRAATRCVTGLLRRQYRLPPQLLLRLAHAHVRVDW